MAFIFGDNLSIADRWHNLQEWSALMKSGSPFSVASGNIEMAIDRSQCPFIIFNSNRLYQPCVIDDSVSGNVQGSGATNGLGLPTTNILMFTDEADPTIFSDNFWWMYFVASGTKRDREIHLDNFNIFGMTGGPNPAVFRTHTSAGVSRLTNSHFIKHVGVNDITVGGVDTRNMTGEPGDKNIFTNIWVQPNSKFPTFLETSSGSSSLFQFDNCELRGHTECLHMFGAGATPFQPLGKRCFMNGTSLRAVYDQQAGAEISGLGGNGVYIHPVVQLRWIGGEAGTSGGGTTEWIPERPIYMNGGTQGLAPDHLIDGVTLHGNAYQGIKCEAGRKADGTQGYIEIRNSTILSFFKGVQNDDTDLYVHHCTFGGGSVSGALPGPTKLGAKMIVENCTQTIDYATCDPQYTGGQSHAPSTGGHATFRDYVITLSAGTYGPNCSSNSVLNCERVTVNAVGSAAAAFAGFLCAASGELNLSNCTVTGQIRPWYAIRSTSVNIEGCNFSGCTVEPRLLEVAANRVISDSGTIMPNLNILFDALTEIQQLNFYDAVNPTPVTSASTLNLNVQYNLHDITGSTKIQTINAKVAAQNKLFHNARLRLRISGGGTWTLGASGNIIPITQSVRGAGTIITLIYNANATKWVEVEDQQRAIPRHLWATRRQRPRAA